MAGYEREDNPERKSYREFWDKRRARTRQIKMSDRVLVQDVGERIHVTVPYRREFVKIATAYLEGRYRARSEVWSFPRSEERALMIYLRRIYGAENITHKVRMR